MDVEVYLNLYEEIYTIYILISWILIFQIIKYDIYFLLVMGC